MSLDVLGKYIIIRFLLDICRNKSKLFLPKITEVGILVVEHQKERQKEM